MSVPNDPSCGEHQHMLGLLAHTAQAYEQSRQARLQAARTARQLGVTYAQIAQAYGVSPSAVNMMLRRAEES